MKTVTVGELRNRGGEVLDRVAAGEHLTITRYGRPVAELAPPARQPLPLETILAHWRKVPPVDPVRLRVDLDAQPHPPDGQESS